MTTQSPPTVKTDSVRTLSSFREIADFLWQNAERLRGAYKPHEYRQALITAAGQLDVTREHAA